MGEVLQLPSPPTAASAARPYQRLRQKTQASDANDQRQSHMLEVLDEGVPVTVVARRYEVARQTVHEWLRRYASEGAMGALADRSSRPES